MPSEDEFDALPDAFEGVDWDAIPAMTQQQPLMPHSSATTTLPPSSPDLTATNLGQNVTNASLSEDYGLTDVDEGFLGEVDALERSLTQAGPRTRQSNLLVIPESPKKNPRKKRSKDRDGSSSPQKKAHLDSSAGGSQTPTKSSSRKSKGKRREKDVHEGVKKVLEGFEDELSCPICCDIFACAHLGNPCGHSFCGECGYDWFEKNRKQPTCAICRAGLSSVAPMIPNFALDNTIEKHVQALAASGVKDWKEGGAKMNEWTHRKEEWKASAAKRVTELKEPVDLAGGDGSSEESEGEDDSSSGEEAQAYVVQVPANPVFRPARGGGGRGRSGWRRPRGGSSNNNNASSGGNVNVNRGRAHRRGRGRGG